MEVAGIKISKSLYVFLLAAALFFTGCAAGQTAARQNKPDELAKVQKVDVRDEDASTTVVVVTDRPVTFTQVRLADPPRMIIDLAGAEPGAFSEQVKVGKGPVVSITPSSPANARRVARLDIVLSRAAESKSAQSGNVINIVFEKAKEEAKAQDKPQPAKPAAAPPSPEEKIETADTAKPRADEKAAEKPQEAQRTVAKAAPVKAAPQLPEAKNVNIITFKKGEADSCLVSIEGDGRLGSPEVFRLGSDRLVADFPGVGSQSEKLNLEVGGKCLKKIRMARHQSPQKKVRVVLDLGCPSDYDIKQDGNRFLLTVAPAGAIPKAAAAKPAAAPAAKPAAAPAAAEAKPAEKFAEPGRAVAKIAAKPADGAAKAAGPVNVYISRGNGKTMLSSSPIEDPAAEKQGGEAKSYVETATKIYTGGKISFDIQDADLDKVVKLLADVAGLNLIMDPADVKGKVTLKLDSVPWDQALDILLRIYNLDKVIEGNVLRVAAKNKLDEERRRQLLEVAEQKRLEQQAEELFTKTFKINYTTAADIEPKVKKVLSPRGDATANTRTNELIVSDVKSNLEKAGKLIVMLDKEVNQIMIEARIITVDVGYSRSLGVSWGLAKNTGRNPSFGAGSGRSSSGVTTEIVDGAKLPLYKVNVPSELIPVAGGFLGNMAFGELLRGVNLDLTIEALETVNKAETLSAPKIITLENQAATITSGTTIYVQTTSAAGTKPEPLNANLSLTVTPRVVGSDIISMSVTATDNKPSTATVAGASAVIDTKSVTTNVLVKDGDTIVLGGVYTRDNNKNVARVPLLGRIPIIGWLFKNQTYEEPQSELLIFITPKLIRQQQV